jgi:hypothetical protein
LSWQCWKNWQKCLTVISWTTLIVQKNFYQIILKELIYSQVLFISFFKFKFLF